MVFDIIKFLFICLEVVLIFNLLIVTHELGHFLAAKWRGLVVEKFAIWFGKPIWKKTIGGVEYRLGSIPAGGFVAIPQLAPMEALVNRLSYLTPYLVLDLGAGLTALAQKLVTCCNLIYVIAEPVANALS